MFAPLKDLAADLAAGKTTSEKLTEEALARIEDPKGEGSRTFTSVFSDAARAEAKASDALRATGIVPSPLAGIPISVKDLFDIRGKVTMAGSVARKDEPAATADAPAIARLRAAGAVIVGLTNMTEFAFSGLGLNPHYGTPKNPYDRATGRIPGGSSSGAAISVTDGMAAAGIGTDTGGSVRIPSALNGLTGFKPTARRVPTEGAFPLSWSLDSIGPLARSVACCALLDAIMAGETRKPVKPFPIKGMRLVVPGTLVLDDMDEHVAKTFEAALDRLSKAGAILEEKSFEWLLEIPASNRAGGFAPTEAYAIHRDLLSRKEADYDPRVGTRIQGGAKMLAADYVILQRRRAEIQAIANAATRDYDAVLMPSVPAVAPSIASLETDDHFYHTTNMLMLRNPSLGNFLDRSAVSLPCHAAGTGPVGLMVVGETMGDAKTLAVAAGIEAALNI
jgi:aspartyl-tRNA(Asn)/glutamyl-tRNA(Gln) amidotransferase subunit A